MMVNRNIQDSEGTQNDFILLGITNSHGEAMGVISQTGKPILQGHVQSFELCREVENRATQWATASHFSTDIGSTLPRLLYGAGRIMSFVL